MAASWKTRQKATRALITAIADDLLPRRNVTADQLYGLCKLTWITRDHLEEDSAYIRSTKLPALRDIFGEDLPTRDLGSAGSGIAERLQHRGAAKLVRAHTGITNFRNAYRNTSRDWLHRNRRAVLDIFRAARRLRSDAEGSALAASIEALPGIPRTPGDQVASRKASGLLTPVVFTLDPRFRFPMINGNPGIDKLLRSKHVNGRSLDDQHDAMVAMIGKGGIKDAGDLDIFSQSLLEIETGTASVLTKKPESGRDLEVKDHRDVQVIARANQVVRKRLHNRMTNWFRELYRGAYRLTEGKNGAAMFDIEVQAFDGQNRLLIEAKSSADEADVRMAIGQLFAYSYHLRRSESDCQAVLLPSRPDDAIVGLLDHLDLGLLWIEDGVLATQTEWLAGFVNDVDIARAARFHRS